MGDNLYKLRQLKWGEPRRLRLLPDAGPARRMLDWLWLPVVAFTLSALCGGMLLGADWSPLRGMVAEAAAPATFRECTHGLQGTCVVDGDTFRLRGEIIRIADIDTPEVHDFGCRSEKALGDRATDRLVALLNAGPFDLRPIDRDTDVYGRSLRIVVRDGASLGGVLVAEGLARQWDGARHPWC